MTDLYPIDRFHVEQQKEAVGAEVRLLEQELYEQGHRKRERLSRDLIDVGLALQRKRLQNLEKRAKRFPPMPGTRQAPLFFTEETSRTGQQ
jgi:hypothetical protein